IRHSHKGRGDHGYVSGKLHSVHRDGRRRGCSGRRHCQRVRSGCKQRDDGPVVSFSTPGFG
ncbi:unnamed protein product, partial [Polarella glacialis]